MKVARLNFDGACIPNPGRMSCGYVIKDEGGEVITKAAIELDQGTNNVAEYQGLIHGLRAALGFGLTDLAVFGDSLIVIGRMGRINRTGQRIKHPSPPAPHLVPLIYEARELAGKFKTCTFHWLRREQNVEADALSVEGQEIADERQQEIAALILGLEFS